MEFPKSLIGGGEYFILRASGNSMVGAGISDGDLLIIQKSSTAKNEQISVVQLDTEVTLKRFYRLVNEQKYRLHPLSTT